MLEWRTSTLGGVQPGAEPGRWRKTEKILQGERLSTLGCAGMGSRERQEGHGVVRLAQVCWFLRKDDSSEVGAGDLNNEGAALCDEEDTNGPEWVVTMVTTAHWVLGSF